MKVMAVIGLLALLLFVLWPRIDGAIKFHRNRGKPVPGLDALVGAGAASRDCVLVYFYSQGCGQCRSMTPRIERLAQECNNVYKVDVDQHREWAVQLGIVGLPSTAVIRKGRLEQIIQGNASERRLRSLAMLSDQSQPA